MTSQPPSPATFAEQVTAKLSKTAEEAFHTKLGPDPALPEPRLGYFRQSAKVARPVRANTSDIGYDIFAHLLTESGRETHRQIPRYNSSAIPTGLILFPSPGYYVQVCSRSGWALQGVFVANSPGIIDPTYSGELSIILYNGSTETKYISHGHRIAQLILCPIVSSELTEITDPPTPSGRGAAGFGSTGL